MVSPNEKLAASLVQLEKLQKDGRRVFRSSEFTRVHRERLVRNGFLRPIIKGWLISFSHYTTPGDTTPWFASFWEFCASYCNARFGDVWHFSPEQSLLFHAENTVVPKQVIIYTTEGSNNNIELPFDTSLYDLEQSGMPPDEDMTILDGLNILKPEPALIKSSAAFLSRNPVEAAIVLCSLRNTTDLLGRLLNDGHSSIAGRLAGALRRVGRVSEADEILTVMKSAGYVVYESDPFTPEQKFVAPDREQAPIAVRLKSMWKTLREPVIDVFPKAPGVVKNANAYLSFVDDIYQSDAYHSLSIEGYRVSHELIERVRSGNWNPDSNDADRRSRDALAARGYWQAFQMVRETVSEVIGGADPGRMVRTAHQNWYRELFQPSVTAGLIPASALAGYRNHPVYLRGSRHMPPRWETVRDAMPVLFDLLESEDEPAVRAVLGHWLFGYIHPYPDGNGRIARFTMNTMLASGGYPWGVILVEKRDTYLSALKQASINQDIQPFALFLAEQVRASIERMAQ